MLCQYTCIYICVCGCIFFIRIVARHQVHELFRCCVAGVGGKILAQRLQAIEEERQRQLQHMNEEEDERARQELEEIKSKEELAILALEICGDDEAMPQEQEKDLDAGDKDVDPALQYEELSPPSDFPPEAKTSDNDTRADAPIESRITEPKALHVEGTNLIQDMVIDGTPVWLKIKVGNGSTLP